MIPKDELPQRKSPRAGWLEYNDGQYFVTVCTHEHKHYLGSIENGVMTLTKVGKCLDGLLNDATSHQSYIRVLQYVVMPNHFHAIIAVNSDGNNVGTRHDASVKTETRTITDAPCRVPTKMGYKLPKLSFFIGSLKSAVTRYARVNGMPFAWQSRYHDHAIRGVDDMNNISEYIDHNVLNWEKDCFNIY